MRRLRVGSGSWAARSTRSTTDTWSRPARSSPSSRSTRWCSCRPASRGRSPTSRSAPQDRYLYDGARDRVEPPILGEPGRRRPPRARRTRSIRCARSARSTAPTSSCSTSPAPTRSPPFCSGRTPTSSSPWRGSSASPGRATRCRTRTCRATLRRWSTCRRWRSPPAAAASGGRPVWYLVPDGWSSTSRSVASTAERRRAVRVVAGAVVAGAWSGASSRVPPAGVRPGESERRSPAGTTDPAAKVTVGSRRFHRDLRSGTLVGEPTYTPRRERATVWKAVSWLAVSSLGVATSGVLWLGGPG